MLRTESSAIRAAIFDMFGAPLTSMFEVLGIAWSWCWFALDVERANLDLSDPDLPSKPGDFDILIGQRSADGSPDFSRIDAIEVKRLPILPNDDMPGHPLGTGQADWAEGIRIRPRASPSFRGPWTQPRRRVEPVPDGRS